MNLGGTRAATEGGLTTLIDGLPIGDFGLGAIVTLVILMIFTGRLVPKRFLDDAIKREQAQQAINELNSASLTEIRGTLRDLVELGRTTDYIVRSIQRGAADPQPRQEATS